MDNFLELCERRYSCRSYKSDAVEPEKVKYILECGRLAPSAVNKQPWRVRVVDAGGMSDLCKAYSREWFQTAPMALVVSVIKDEAWTRADGKNHADIDGAIFTEHLCLAAAAQGLGSCWICNFDADVCRNLFDLAHSEEIIAIIPIGYPADAEKPKNRKTLEQITV